MEDRIYAVIDANINRSIEGLRVCEDIFRFVVLNNVISLKIKNIRHSIAAAVNVFPGADLLQSRNVEKDAQKFADVRNGGSGNVLYDIAKRNLHRSMEAMRSIEEFYKSVCPGANNPFQEIRFSLYSLEKEIIPVLIRDDKRKKLCSSLYAILDSAFVPAGKYIETAGRLIDGGASVIQLRMKDHPMGEILHTAISVSQVCKDRGVLFIVNDYPGIAYLSEADGVHLGQDDLPVHEARRVLPAGALIGISTHSPEQALAAMEFLPDYVAIGPVYDTKTKNNELIKGIGESSVMEVLRNKDIDMPVVAIGGLNPERIAKLKETGAEGLSYAVISYLYLNGKIEENCARIVNNI